MNKIEIEENALSTPSDPNAPSVESKIEYNAIWDQMSIGFQLSHHVHGPAHWKQVEKNGLKIARKTGADEIVVRLFAVLHDSQRSNDGYDPEHGERAAEVAQKLRNELFVVTDEQMEQLCEALRMHNNGLTSDDITIGTCWDADRMDLPRVGIGPTEEFMSTEYGKKWANRYQLEE